MSHLPRNEKFKSADWERVEHLYEGRWEDIAFDDLRAGEIFRLYPVSGEEHLIWYSTIAPHYSKDEEDVIILARVAGWYRGKV